MKALQVILTLGLVFVSLSVFGQEVPSDFTPDTIFDHVNLFQSALIVIGGYLSSKIPLLNRIGSPTYRVLSWAILTGIGFVTFGFGTIWQAAISYFVSTSMYEVILQWVAKTPK